jgi:cyclophilin family peptidyl-prolyl cis-trans isomerase/HEAT repeat protein
VKAALIVCTALLLAQQTLVRQRQDPATRDDSGVPAAVLNAERHWGGSDLLLPLAASADPKISTYAIRALGRLEEVELIPKLLALLPETIVDPLTDPIAADAIAQTLHRFDSERDPELISRVAERFRRLADNVDVTKSKAIVPLGRLRYVNPHDVSRAERILTHLLNHTTTDLGSLETRIAAVRSLEFLARVNSKLVAFEPATTAALRSIVTKPGHNDTPVVRLYGVMALAAARAASTDSLDAALRDDDEQVRRVAMAALGGPNLRAADDVRRAAVNRGLADPSVLVRYESLRVYVRGLIPAMGCEPLLAALGDRSLHVALAAIDAAGDMCRDDRTIGDRLVAETKAPAADGSWHRPAHAFVAMAKRSPEQASSVMQQFRSHPVWQVRMYAARAAGAMRDTASLEVLAGDRDDNVREATLGPLQKLGSAHAETALIDALGRPDYQLLRTAALLLKDLPIDPRFLRPLSDALLRVTREGKETSRDTRMALLDAVERHGGPDAAADLKPLLNDFDPRIAERAADLITRWTKKTVTAEPRPLARGSANEAIRLQQCVQASLKNGRSFRMEMQPRAAAVTVGHFLKLATVDHYYDGLTFHRVEPNFVVQGGSPGANEYAGQKEYMRDEIGLSNRRGTIGLSTRGRNTGDAQLYINLVDNPRLDEDYTIFARVFAADLPVVDDIKEGDEIVRMSTTTACR